MFIPVDILNAQLAALEGTRVHICSSEPLDYNAVITTQLAAADIIGGYIQATGDISGRKNTLDAQNAIPITTAGTPTNYAITDGVDTLYQVTECTGVDLVSGTVDASAFTHEIGDPV